MDNDLLVDAFEQLLKGAAPSILVRAIEDGAPHCDLWQAIERSGFCDALVGEAEGGAGLDLREALPLVQACGRHVVPVPVSQTMAGRALLARAGLDVPLGSIALASQTGALHQPVRVAFGRVADHVLLQNEGFWVLLDAHQAERIVVEEESVDAELLWSARALHSAPRASAFSDLRCLEACLLAGLLSGNLEQVVDMTLRYANDRMQFSRPIGKFQAVQHQLSVMAEHSAAARMGAEMAYASGRLEPAPLAAAVAKARASEAAAVVAAGAHAIHGAIGITADFSLQLHTRRLHAWRVCAGSESYWNARVGAALVASPHLNLLDFVRIEVAAPPT